MGGGYYDRDSNPTPASITNNGSSETGSGFSSVANEVVGKRQEIHPFLDPKRWMTEMLYAKTSNPIVFALDVTGSMGEWTKIIYDKLPMFYGQIMMQKYLKHPSLSFCAVGDVKTDNAPLQICEFCEGVELDEKLCYIYLEGKGGGNQHESYDLAAYFYSEKVILDNVDMPFFFLTCDEKYYDECNKIHFKKVFGHTISGNQEKIVSKDYWKKILKKYNFFILRKEFKNKNIEPLIQKQWERMIGQERVLKISTPKAVIDIILGALCLTSGSRNLDQYIQDLKNRGQTKERIQEVTHALANYWNMIKKNPQLIVRNTKYKEEEENTASESNEQLHSLQEYTQKAFFESQEYNEEKKILFKNLLKLTNELRDKIPDNLICPLTQVMYCDPVKTPEGKTYEKLAILHWLETNAFDPLTKNSLKKEDLCYDNSLSENVSSFYDSIKIFLDQL